MDEDLGVEDGDLPGSPARLKTKIYPKFMGDPTPYMPHSRQGPSVVWPFLRSIERKTGHPFMGENTTPLLQFSPPVA
jgi:hypothetical protein